MKKTIALIVSLLFLLPGCRNKQAHTDFRSLDDLKHARIAVIAGTLHDLYVTNHYPEATALRLDTYSDMLMTLERGKADAACVEGDVFNTVLKPKGIYRDLGVLFDDPYGVGFNKNNPELCNRFNAFLDDLKQNGMLEEMINRWINNYQTARMPDLGPEPAGEPIRIGCCADIDVFDFIQDGQFAGFDIEMIERFGRNIGRPVEFLPINFGGLIASLASGKVDMICSAITINEERSKRINFSKPYFVSQSHAIVMNQPQSAADEGKPGSFKTTDDVKDKRIGVLMSSIQDEYISKTYPKAQVLRIDLTPDLVMSLKTKQCDAIVLPEPEAGNILEKDSTIGILDRDIYGVDFGVGFNDTILRNKFNAYLSEIRANGDLGKMGSRWLNGADTVSMPAFDFPPGAKPLIVGTTAQDKPFTFMRGNACTGFDMELTVRFAASLGRPLKFSVMSFGGLIPALTSGRIDIIASSAMITEERKKQVAISDPYFHVGSTVLVLKENLDRPSATAHDGSDIATARIATMTGTTSAIFIGKEYPQAQLLLFDDINDAFLAVASGKADYVLTSYTTSVLAAKHNKGLLLLPKEYNPTYDAIAFNKKDTALLRQVNEIMVQYKKDGTIQDMINRWIKAGDSGYQPVEIPSAAKGVPLRIGIAANREPMCFISNGKTAGLDAELIERIAYKLGRPVQYFDMKFSGLVAAIESGAVDAVISNIGVTEERKQHVNFSEVYYVNPQVFTTFSENLKTKHTVKSSAFSKIKESFISNLVVEKRYMLILEGLKETVIITLFSILLGTIVGGLICFLRMSRNRLMVGFAKAYINLMRGTPILVLLMILFYVVFVSTGLSATVVAVIAFAMNMGAYASEMFRTSIQSVEKGQTEAGIALGFTKMQTFVYVVFPQALKNVIPVYKGEVISLLKNTSIVGYIAAVDLTKASDLIRSRTFDAFFPLIVITVIYFLVAWLLSIALDKLNFKTSAK